MHEYFYPLLCFLGYAIAAFLWTIIVLALNKGAATTAILIGMVQTTFSLITVKLVVTDSGILTLVAAVLGDGVGMSIAIYMERWWKRRQKEKKDEHHNG